MDTDTIIGLTYFTYICFTIFINSIKYLPSYSLIYRKKQMNSTQHANSNMQSPPRDDMSIYAKQITNALIEFADT